jgi:hypothetical protein
MPNAQCHFLSRRKKKIKVEIFKAEHREENKSLCTRHCGERFMWI